MKAGSNSLALHLLVRDIDARVNELLPAAHAARKAICRPRPVRAVKARLLPAPEARAKVPERREGEPLERWRLRAHADYEVPTVGEADLNLLVEAVRFRRPPFYARMARDQIQRPVRFEAAAALYWKRPHAVHTAELQTSAAHTDIGEDVPALPFRLRLTMRFLRFVPEMAKVVKPKFLANLHQLCNTTGGYMFETHLGERRDIASHAMGSAAGKQRNLIRSLQLSITEQHDSLIDHALNILRSGASNSADLASAQTCAEGLLYLRRPCAVRIYEVRLNNAEARLSRGCGIKGIGTGKATDDAL